MSTETELMALLKRLEDRELARDRQIPLIENLTSKDDFPIWRTKLIRILKRHDLDRYILTDVPEPDDAAAKQT